MASELPEAGVPNAPLDLPPLRARASSSVLWEDTLDVRPFVIMGTLPTLLLDGADLFLLGICRLRAISNLSGS
jgi:hypothetical protein